MTKRTKPAGPLFGGPLDRPQAKYDRTYVGRLGRENLRGRHCRVLVTWRRQGPHNVLVEFEGGERVVVPIRTIRKRKDAGE